MSLPTGGEEREKLLCYKTPVICNWPPAQGQVHFLLLLQGDAVL